jgi:hypothetical protein
MLAFPRGAQNLGDYGPRPGEYLEHYYGQNIYLAQAGEGFGRRRYPSPGLIVRVGSTGPAVRTIQTQLKRYF